MISSTLEHLEKSPFLERLKKKGYEVIYFTDQVDDYLMQYMMDYQDKKFQNVFEEGLKLGKESKAKELEESFKELTKWWKSALARENVDDDDSVKQTAQLMYQMALMESGFMLNNPNDSASRTYSSVKSRLSISPDASIFEEEDDVEEAEVETETKEATSNTEAEPAKDDDEDTEPSAVKDELEIT